MTQEQKAKAYDEAFEIARKINSGEGVPAPPDWTICEVIFPELKESEDERIIRAIIDALYSHTNSINLLSSRNYQMEDIEAWLEKQKKQKPEWSEEDKFKLEDAITGIDAGIGFYEREGKHPNLLKAIIEAKEWLKSLHPQPKQEWSEEDKHRCGDAIYFLETAKKHYADTSEIELTIEWLKSLQPQVKQKQKPEVKLTGWVARDMQHDPFLGLGLVLFEGKPRRSCGCWSGEIAAQLPWELFPDLKWEDEPVEVEITIRRR